jgi:hypothetical protein
MSDNRKQHQDRESDSERGHPASEPPVREVGRATRDVAGRATAGLERGAAAGAEGVRQVGRSAREGASRTEEWIERAAEDMEEAGESVAETGTHVAKAAVQTGQRVADQGRAVLLSGARAAAGVNSQLADAGYDSGRQLLGSAVRVFDIYREAGERSAHHLRALFDSWMSLGRGMQQIQHAALELADRAVGQAKHKPQDLLRVNSLEQWAEVQRDLYLDALNYAFDASTRVLELATSGAQEAIRPLRSAESGDRPRRAE